MIECSRRTRKNHRSVSVVHNLTYIAVDDSMQNFHVLLLDNVNDVFVQVAVPSLVLGFQIAEIRLICS